MYVTSYDQKFGDRKIDHQNNRIIITPKKITNGDYILNQCFLILQLTIDRIKLEKIPEEQQSIINLFKTSEKFIDDELSIIRRKIETFLWWMNFGSDILLRTLIDYADEICAQYIVQNLGGKLERILTYKTDLFNNDFEAISIDNIIMLFYNPIIFESIFSQTVFFINTYSEALGVDTFYNKIPSSRLDFNKKESDSDSNSNDFDKDKKQEELLLFREKIKSNIYNGIDLTSEESLKIIQEDITNEIRLKSQENYCKNSLNNNIQNENLLHSFDRKPNQQSKINSNINIVYGQNCINVTEDKIFDIVSHKSELAKKNIEQNKQNNIPDDEISERKQLDFDDSNVFENEYKLLDQEKFDRNEFNINFMQSNSSPKINILDRKIMFETLYKKSKWNKIFHDQLLKLTANDFDDNTDSTGGSRDLFDIKTSKVETDIDINQRKTQITLLIIEILEKFNSTYNFNIICQFLLQCDRVLDTVYNIVFKRAKLNLRTIRNEYQTVSVNFGIVNK